MRNIDWDGLFQRKRDYTYFTTSELTELLDRIKPTYNSAIDLGCGTGQLSRELYHRGFNVAGIDGSNVAISVAKDASRYVTYFQSDLEKPFPDEILSQKYDLAICKLVFAFIENKDAFIVRSKEILNKNGVFVIITPTLEQVTPEKRNIAVNLDETIRVLEFSFNTVENYESNGSTVFIAKH